MCRYMLKSKDAGRREYEDFVVRFIHKELEGGASKELRWAEDGRAFEILGKIRIPRAGGGVREMGRMSVERILLRFEFQKMEGSGRHVYLHRGFRRGEAVDVEWMRNGG